MQNRKTILLTIIGSLYGGGAEKFTADISEGFSQRFEHHIVTYNKKESYPVQGQLTHLNIPSQKGIFQKVNRQFEIQMALRSLKKKLQPQTSISHMLMANLHNILSKNNDYTICVLHGEWSVTSGNNFLDFFIRRIYKKADMVVSVSHYIKNMFDSKYGLKVPHFVIHNAVDVNAIKKSAEEEVLTNLPEKYLVYVAGFRPVKNHLKLIEQLEHYLKRNDIHLVLIGDGPLRNEIEAKIKLLHLKNKVHLLGNLKNPHPVVKNAYLSLLVSSSESFSLVLVEAMVLGVPVIATDCGGPREILLGDQVIKKLPQHTKYGILIDKPEHWSKNSLVYEISEICTNETLRNQLSINGMERATFFDISKAVESYQELIEKHNLENAK